MSYESTLESESTGEGLPSFQEVHEDYCDPVETNESNETGNQQGESCAWFLLCENPATTTRKHSVLGDVPICERCNSKMNAI